MWFVTQAVLELAFGILLGLTDIAAVDTVHTTASRAAAWVAVAGYDVVVLALLGYSINRLRGGKR